MTAGGAGGDAAAGGRVRAGDRAALLRKYRLLARWRRAKDREHAPGRRDDHAPADAEAADRAAMRALAAEFPGALRELDRLGAIELERRVAVLETGGEEAWIGWILAYHEAMARVLAEKRAGRGERSPEGRASVGVLRDVGARFGRAPDDIGNVLFPPRRGTPHGL